MAERTKRPSFQWYPGDAQRDTALRACSLEARGLWREMMDLMHDGEPYGYLTAGGVPIADASLASLIGVTTRKCIALLVELDDRGVFSRTEEGVIYSRRMVRDERKRNARAAGGERSLDNPNVPRPKDGNKDGPKDTFPPSFGGSPAVAVGSLQSATDSSSPPRSSSWQPAKAARLVERLTTEAGRTALTAILHVTQSDVGKVAIVNEITMMLTGDRGATLRATPEQMDQALSDYVSNGMSSDRWNAKHFAACVRSAMRPRDEQPANGKRLTNAERALASLQELKA